MLHFITITAYYRLNGTTFEQIDYKEHLEKAALTMESQQLTITSEQLTI